MINDTDIDLTIDSKFCHSWRHNKRYTETVNKLTSRKRDIFELGIFASRGHEIPWIKKEQELSRNSHRVVRSYNDSLSDMFGATIRTTSNNDIVVYSKTSDYFHHDDVVNDFFLECVGKVPYTAITRCFRCGSLLLYSQRDNSSIPFMCNNCGISYQGNSKTPWDKK